MDRNQDPNSRDEGPDPTPSTRADEVAELRRRLRDCERLLQAESRRFERLFAQSPLALLLADADGRFTDANPSALAQLGIPDEATVRRLNLFRVVPWSPENIRRLQAEGLSGVNADLDFDEIARRGLYQPKRSGRAHIDWLIAPVADGFFIQIQDITERVLAQGELAERERLFSALFAAIPYPTLLWRQMPSDRIVLDRYNDAALEASEGLLAGLVGVDLDAFYGEETRFPRRIRETLRTGAPQSDELLYQLRTTGAEQWIVTTSARVGPGLVLDSMADVSSLKQTEERLAAALQEKSLLLREIHHRVKNNLAVIASLLSLQAERSDDPRIVGELDRSRLRILSVARLYEALDESADADSVDAATYVRALARRVREAVARDDVRLDLEVDPVTLPVSRAVHVGLILNELLTNAFQHAFVEAAAIVEPRVRLEVRTSGQDLGIELSDNGVGLPAGISSPVEAGSLGAQVVDTLVAQLGGTSAWRQAPGGGTTVALRIPLNGPDGAGS